MALSSNQYALIVQRLEKIFVQRAAPKGPEWPSYCNLGNVTQNPHFPKKCKRGTNRNFSKITRKSTRLKGPKALQTKSHYPLLSMLSKCKDWKRFSRKERLQKGPNGQVIAIQATSPKTRIFLKSAKGGPIEIFQKSPEKALALKAQKPSRPNRIILYLVCSQSAKTGKNLGANSGSKTTRIAKLWQFLQGHPKPAFS